MSGDRRARIGSVGAGRHATGTLYPNIPRIPEAELVAVCDLDADKAEDAARRCGSADPFSDVATMLGRVAPDGVEALRLIDAIMESAESGAPASVGER